MVFIDHPPARLAWNRDEHNRHPVAPANQLKVRAPMSRERFTPAGPRDLRAEEAAQCRHPAHNAPSPEIQDVADYVGDSSASPNKPRRPVPMSSLFCGVHFMAETAKILNPNKIVVLPDKDAGCSLEESCPPKTRRLAGRPIPTSGPSPTSIAARR